MVKFHKNNPDESMHRWLSTGSILLPHESLGDDRPESIPYIDSEEEIEFPSKAENGKLKNDISFASKPLPAIPTKRSKYRDSLKLLLPWRRPGRHKQELPSSHAGCFSYLSVGWLSRLMQRAFQHGIQKDDLWDLPETDAAKTNADRLERLWKEELRKYGKKASFVRAAYKFCRTRAIISALLICLAMVFQFISPAILLRLLLQNVGDPSSSTQSGVILAFGLYLAQLLRTAFLSLAFVIGLFTGIRLQGAIQIFLYNKLLRTRQIGEKQVGQIVNCYTNDMERLFESAVTGSLALATPVMFIMTLTYSCHLLGPWALLGHVIILFFYPVMGGLAALTTMLRRKAVKHTDKRVQLMNEVITSIKLIKMYAWEQPFAKKISDIRQSEKQVLQQSAFLQSLSTSISPSIVIIATVATLLGHTLSGNPLNAPLAFTVLTVFLALQFSIGTLPYAVKGIAEGRVALQRMQKFLQIAEVNKWNTGDSRDVGAVIKIIGATLTWYVPGSENIEEKNRKNNRHSNVIRIEECSPLTKEMDPLGETTLKEITVIVKKGSLVGICGSVGSGKSSLLSAICGDMTLLEGSIVARGNIAFVTQQAWIFNNTLRENILFSLPYDKEKYNHVINACCLTQDLELLPQGDLTEIGERGVNLSGGQRQRVSLARALYSNSDLYLLDDPLSAVDTKVASHIFQHCIQASLPEKTVLLVTHAMHVLEKCDTVLFMKRGQILERGTHAELMAKDGEYAHMFHLDKAKSQGAIGADAKKHEEHTERFRDEPADDDNESSKLIAPEEMAVGSISWRAYSHYISAMGGPCIAGLLLISFVIFVCAQLFTTVWLKYWMDQFGEPLIAVNENTTANINETNFISGGNATLSYQYSSPLLEWHYQLIYAVSVLMILIFGIVKGISCAKIVIKAASVVHDQMFKKVIRSPMSFFETSPSGRILNRFSKDMDELDVRIPFFLEIVIQSLLFIAFQLYVSVFVYHLFIIALLLAIVLFVVLDWWLNVGVREFKRLDNVLRSSVVVHLTTTLQGLSVIRMYCCQAWFSKRFYSLVDQHSVAHIIFHLAARWFTFRMEIVGVTVMGSAALTVVLMKGSTTTGSAGLVLATLFQVCTFLPYVMRLKSELLARFTSMERISSYCRDLCEEAPDYVSGSIAPSDWPQMGVIEFRDVCLRYRDGLPLVLDSISFKIEGGQKVGVVGRTGAGKSSLITCLLRLVELDSGSILIDDIDICTLGLKQLRNSLAVIPQDPVLFEGTVRYNLDPFGDNTDNELWDALDRVHLKYKIGQEEKQLEARVEKNGDNFSVGERQLLCLARALLRKNKVLMLDEATASVDVETDHLIQATIREMFYTCTVITIAHRLNTIWSSDKVLVMKDGKVVEFDSPAALLSREGSLFNSMLGAMGK